MAKSVVVLSTLDTKGKETAFLKEQIEHFARTDIADRKCVEWTDRRIDEFSRFWVFGERGAHGGDIVFVKGGAEGLIGRVHFY